MKTHILIFSLFAIIFGCTPHSAPPSEEYEVLGAIDFGSFNPLRSTISSQKEQYGQEVLLGYYYVGNAIDKDRINTLFNLSLESDLLSKFHSEEQDTVITVLNNAVYNALKDLPSAAQNKEFEKAITWINIKRVFNDAFCNTDVYSFLNIAYEFAPFQELIHQHINPDRGQYVESLTSAQLSEVEVEIWNYLANAEKKEQLELMGEMMNKCAKVEIEE